MSLKKILLIAGSVILLVVIVLLLSFSIFTKGNNDELEQSSEIYTEVDIDTLENTHSDNPEEVVAEQTLDLSQFDTRKNNRQISGSVNNSNLDQLLIIQKDTTAFKQSLQDIKNTLIKSENELADLRIKNINDIKDTFKKEGLEYFIINLDETINIEELRKKNNNFILSDILFEVIAYEIDIENKIKNISSLSSSEVSSFINTHKNKMTSFEKVSKQETENVIAKGVEHSRFIQNGINTVIGMASEYVSIQNQLNSLSSSGSRIVSDTSAKLQNIYNSIPSYTPQNVSGSSNCISVKDKYALVAGKGWVKMKECTNGTYIEADKYIPYKVEQTPKQLCDQRKAAKLAGYYGGAVDCNDLGL